MKNRKKLLVGIMAIFVAALAAVSCKKEDKAIIPVEISISQEFVEIDSIGGTATLTIKSNRDWIVEKIVDNPWGNENANWLEVTPESGKASASEQTITIKASPNVTDSTNYERTVIVYFRTDKELFANTIVHQNGIIKPNSWKTVEIKYVRALAPEDKTSKDKITIDKPLMIKGVVVSSNSPMTVSKDNLFVQDGTDPHSGLLIYTSAFGNCNFGDVVEVKLKGGTLQYYNQLLELVPSSPADVSKTGEKQEPAHAELDGATFVKGDYEGQYVKLYAQVINEDLGKTMGNNPKVETEDGESFIMYSRKDDVPWGNTAVPQGAGDLFGLCSSYGGIYQIVPQREKDFSGLTKDRFKGMPTVVTGDAVINGAVVTVSGSYIYEGDAAEIKEVGIALKKNDEETDFVRNPAQKISSEFSVTFNDLESAAYSYKAYVKKGERYYEGKIKTFDLQAEATLTCSQLAAMLKEMETGASLASCGTYVKGIVAANNEGGNLNKALSVVDGNGEPNSGIYIYGQSDFNTEFKVGDEVKVTLINAKLSIFNGLREITWDVGTYNKDVEVVSSGNMSTTPEITVAQLLSDDYQGMYVTVKNVKSAESAGTAWTKDNKATNVKFTDGTDEFDVRTSTYVEWKDEQINPDVTANISGVSSIFNATVQLLPVVKSDIAAFIGEANTPQNVSISDVRALYKGTDITIAEDWTIEGIMLVDTLLNNQTSKKNIIIADENAGIQLRLTADNKICSRGDLITVKLKNLKLQKYNGTLQINDVPAENMTFVEKNKMPEPVSITADQLLTGDYESRYVAVSDVEIEESEMGKTFVMDGKHTSINFISKTGEKFVLFSSKYSTYGNETVPDGSGILKGIGMVFEKNDDKTYQLSLTSKQDYEDLTNPRF